LILAFFYHMNIKQLMALFKTQLSFCFFALLCSSFLPPKAEAKLSKSWVPILGYNSTYRFFGGGGYYVADKDQEYELGSNGVITQQLVTKIESTARFKLSDNWFMELYNELANGFEPNYGRGSQTRAEDRVDVDLVKDSFVSRANYKATDHVLIGPFVDFRIRTSKDLSYADYMHQQDAIPRQERVMGFGVRQRLDHTDRPESPTKGWMQNFTIKGFPLLFKHQENAFAQVEADVRYYYSVFSPDLILAHAISGGLSFGRPTYLNEYRLGGTDRLRGFLEDRFRGKKYYLGQTELRFPIWKLLSAATFVELGEVSDGSFESPRLSYGLGLRIGLPPDYISKVRIDVGFSKDQTGVFMDFGMAF